VVWDTSEGVFDPFQDTQVDDSTFVETFDIKTNPMSIDPKDMTWGMEVGDDRIDVSTSKYRLSVAIKSQSTIFDMKTSLKDTFITNNLWNFCEVSSVIPASPLENFQSVRLSGNFRSLGFVDTPPIRTIIDCMKADKSHSSTVSGKAAMLGVRMETPRTSLRHLQMIASYLQDGILSTYRSPDPKYLPSIMGGCNVPALFDNSENIFLYTQSYRGGGFDRLYGTATEELKRAVESIDNHKPVQPILCLRLRDKQEYLWATYDHMVFIPEKATMDFRGTLPAPLYKQIGVDNGVQSVELRLQRTKVLVPRSLAEREYDKTVRIHDAIFGTSGPINHANELRRVKYTLRKEFEGALQANTAFMRLINRNANGTEINKLLGSDFLMITTGTTQFSKRNAKWIFDGCRGSYASAADVTRTEDMFLRTDVSTEETFKVGGIPLRVRLFGKTKDQTTKTQVGLYQINESMIEWSDRLERSLRILQGKYNTIPRMEILKLYSTNREWVNDDTGLIAQCLADTHRTSIHGSVLLVSQDRRLANQMAITCNVTVHLIDTVSLVEVFPNVNWNANIQMRISDITDKIRKGYFFDLVPTALYFDTGSLAHVASRYIRGANGVRDRAIYKRTLISSDYLPNGNRRELVELEQIPPIEFLTVVAYRPRVNRQKSFKSRSSGSSDSNDWRNDRPLPDQHAVRSWSFSSDTLRDHY